MKSKLLTLFFIFATAILYAQENAASKPAKTIQPKIMVIPRVPQGQNMKVYYDTSMNMQIAIAKINEAFQKRGANLRSFDQVLKQTLENKIINKASGNTSDSKSDLLESSGSDIYVEAKIDVVTHTARSAKSVTIILDAYQTGTGNSLATKTIPGNMFQTDDIGRLTMVAMDGVSEEFLNLLQLKFDDIVENGQSVYVEFTLSPNATLTFDDEVAGTQGKILSEVIEEWLLAHAKNGIVNGQGTTGNKMILSDVRIPLKRPDNPNLNYTGQTLYTDILKYFRTLKINIKREIGTNNKILITIL